MSKKLSNNLHKLETVIGPLRKAVKDELKALSKGKKPDPTLVTEVVDKLKDMNEMGITLTDRLNRLTPAVAVAARFFEHPSNIPVEFAMAVYRVMHNKATYNDWELFDSYIAKNEDVLSWVVDVLKANKVRNLKDERKWWAEQLGITRSEASIKTKGETVTAVKVDQKVKKEFQKYAEEILRNLLKEFGDRDFKPEHLRHLARQIMGFMTHELDSPNYKSFRKYMPNKYKWDLFGVDSRDGGVWMAQTDAQRNTIIKKAWQNVEKEFGTKPKTGGRSMRTKGMRTKGMEVSAKGLSEKQKAYREFFKGVMQKWGISSPAELDEADKKKFFTEVEKGWNERQGKRTERTSATVSVSNVVQALVDLGEVEIAEALENELTGNRRWSATAARKTWTDAPVTLADMAVDVIEDELPHRDFMNAFAKLLNGKAGRDEIRGVKMPPKKYLALMRKHGFVRQSVPSEEGIIYHELPDESDEWPLIGYDVNRNVVVVSG